MICLLGALVLPILDHSWNAEASDLSQGISANQKTGVSITDQSEARLPDLLAMNHRNPLSNPLFSEPFPGGQES